MKTIFTPDAPETIGPYSQAKISGNFVFTSGQIPVNPKTGAIEEPDITGQTVQVCKNVKAILEAAGSGMNKVVKTMCFWQTSPTLPTLTKFISNTSSPLPRAAALR